ncbi:tetratricopeptide repeat protein [Acinetobacter variabilis]|uniref:tetratricopeptide repeat protein n=1 Tax=Acinetobacter variabilis TaxID=70346 RepID=UPI00289930D9|nr:tetratricopeptide repeat protein [Acinetobacter variabilis]
MLKKNIKENLIIGMLLFMVFILAFYLYIPGLKGVFLFDDFPNLASLEAYTYQYNFDEAKKFVENGFSGPTGRPIALASFLSQAAAWPNDPYPFKLINVFIHLVCGLLLYWAILLLLKSYQYNQHKSAWIALIATAMWLLHPYLVSTVLYVIQRMAQLSLLFSLIAIVGYLKGRSYLLINQTKSYIVMSISIVIGTVLATYSKENGALTPLLILVIEFLHPKGVIKPYKYWRLIFLWIPSIAIGILLLKELNFSDNIWPNRNFNQKERLLTEARVLIDYLSNLYIPQFEKHGLYQDGILISKSIFAPMTTLLSIISILILMVAALFYRNKYPLFALAILFFFASHLMESTLIGLEIYFEHRNYVGASFLFLPIAASIYYLYESKNKKIAVLIGVLILSFLSFMTYQRTTLWGGGERLTLYWAQNSPNSPRAQYEIVNYFIKRNHIEEAEHYLTSAVDHLPESALLNLYLLIVKTNYGKVQDQDYIDTYERLKLQKFDTQAFEAVKLLTDIVIERGKQAELQNTLIFLKTLDEFIEKSKFYPYWQNSPYLQAKIYLKLDQPQDALIQYQYAFERLNMIEAGLKMVAELASGGYSREAKLMLDLVNATYQNNILKDPKQIKYKDDIENLYRLLT